MCNARNQTCEKDETTGDMALDKFKALGRSLSYLAVSPGLPDSFRLLSAFLLLRPDFDCCLAEPAMAMLETVLSLFVFPLIIVVAMLAVIAGRHPRPGPIWRRVDCGRYT